MSGCNAIAGCRFASCSDERVHGTTGETPIEHFGHDEAGGTASAGWHAAVRQGPRSLRRVGADCAIEVDGGGMALVVGVATRPEGRCREVTASRSANVRLNEVRDEVSALRSIQQQAQDPLAAMGGSSLACSCKSSIDGHDKLEQRSPTTCNNIIVSLNKGCRVPHEVVPDRLSVHYGAQRASKIRHEETVATSRDHEVLARETKWGIVLDQKIGSCR